MEAETLQEIYLRFIKGEVSLDRAAQQVMNHTRLHKNTNASLDFDGMKDEDRDKAVELLGYILRPIENQFFSGEISAAEAARQMAPFLWPHGSWALTVDVSHLPIDEQEKLRNQLNDLLKALATKL